MIVFDPTNKTRLYLTDINETIQNNLNKKEEFVIYSGNILERFFKGYKKDIKEAENFIQLIEKMFFLKKVKILPFDLSNEDFYRIVSFEKDYTYCLINLSLNYIFLKKMEKNIKTFRNFFKMLEKRDNKRENNDVFDFIKDFKKDFDFDFDLEIVTTKINEFINYCLTK